MPERNSPLSWLICTALSLTACTRPASHVAPDRPPKEATEADIVVADLPPPASEEDKSNVAKELAAPLPARIEFEAGELAWAKPDHRVVFHTKTESNTLRDAKTLDPIMGGWNDAPKGTEDRTDNFYHMLTLPSSHDLFVSYFPLEVKNSQPASARPWPRWQGFYFPEELSQDETPTLHIFEVGALDRERTRYLVGGLVVDIYANYDMRVFIPEDTDYGRWFRCSAIATLRYVGKGCEDVEVDAQILTPTDVVLWPGLDPSSQTDIQPLLISSKLHEAEGNGFPRSDYNLLDTKTMRVSIAGLYRP